MLPFLGPLLGFAGTIGSALIGSGQKQQTVNTVDYKRMVRDAEAAGFNPLTALRAGGAAGFTTTTHPALSAAGGIGAAFANLGNAITDYDPNAALNEQLSRDLQRAQLAQIQAETRQTMRSFDVRPAAGAAVVGSPGGWSGTEPGAYTGVPLTPTVEQPTVTNPHQYLDVDPATPDAAGWEERYGEPGGIPGAVVTLDADIRHNLRTNPGALVRGANQLMHMITPAGAIGRAMYEFMPELSRWDQGRVAEQERRRQAYRDRKRPRSRRDLKRAY